MFGIIRPCQHRLSERLHTDWVAHLCGLCLTLRGEHGQTARTATNYDGLVISVLVEAQSGEAAPRRRAGPCPLRGMRRASVVQGEGARLAAAVSLVLASVKLRDHADDGDGALRHAALAGPARRTAARWGERGETSGAHVGFDTALLTEAAGRQQEVEESLAPGDSVLVATEPTELATSAAFEHTAVLAERPANAEPLAEVGRLFGRVAHLIDAVEDLADDTANGSWNPLVATDTGPDEARRLCDDAVRGVRLALREAEFTDSKLVHVLLVHELEQAVRRAFGHAVDSKDERSGPNQSPQDGQGGGCWSPKFRVPSRKRHAAVGCLLVPYMCCSCQFCCRDPYPGPCSGEPHGALCSDCCDCDCCQCGQSCECCSCDC